LGLAANIFFTSSTTIYNTTIYTIPLPYIILPYILLPPYILLYIPVGLCGEHILHQLHCDQAGTAAHAG
jgi:hypothetical protein